MMTLWPMMASAVSGVVLMPLAMRAHQDAQHEFRGPQVIHHRPTSRLGGAIVFVAYTGAVVAILSIEHSARRAGLALVFAALPVFVVGLVEDCTHRVAPTIRLAAALASAILATAASDVHLTRLDVPGLDNLVAFGPIALLCTWFMVAGVCNAINIIDGSHGLAGGTAWLLFAGLGGVASALGDRFVAAGALAMIGALTAFLLWNYPRGRIFLGDAGAYFLGFTYAELSIQLVVHNPDVSPWFPLALAAYPITETLYSMYRRGVVAHAAPMQPDVMHLHSLVYRRLRDAGVRHANRRVAPRLWAHTAVCLVAASALRADTGMLALFVSCYAAYYIATYRALLRVDARAMAPIAAARD